jgi:hypothetical protein
VNRRRKRILALVATAALAAFGGGVAYAAASGDDPQEKLLDDAAQRLNVTPDDLRSALEGAFGDQLDDAVRAGRLTQEQADRMKQALRDHGLPLLGGPGGPGERHVFMAGPIGPGLDAAAAYLGLSRAELRRRLVSGRSLAEIARAEGKSVDGLEQAILDAVEADLARAVADGRLTDAQRDELLRDLREHVDEMVAGRGPVGPCGPGGFGARRGHGMLPPLPPGAFDRRDERGGDSGGESRPGSFEQSAPAPDVWS